MATLDIRINPSTFSAGGALAVAYTGTTTLPYPPSLVGGTIIPLGSGGFVNGKSPSFPVTYSSSIAADPAAVVGAFQITVNAATYADSVQLNRSPQWIKNSLADLVAKGIVIVEIGGVAQTAAQIVALV